MAVIQMSVFASVLIIAVIIARALFLHKIPKMTFLVLWGIAAFRLLVPLRIPSVFSVYTGLDMLKNLFVEEPFLPVTEAIVGSDRDNISGTGEPAVTAAPASAATLAVEFIWLAGMCICMLFFIVMYVKCVKRFKMSSAVENDLATQWICENPLRRIVKIRQNDYVGVPLVYGVFRPVVLFPKGTDWTDERRMRYILTHEYTHIRRFDMLTKLLLTVVVCIHWFNPFVWTMYVLANRDIELSCDETVIRSFGETTKSAYAMTLLGLEEKKGGFTPLVTKFSKNSVEERIVSIMKTKKLSIRSIAFALLLVVSVSSAFATNAFGFTDSKLNYATKVNSEEGTFIENPSGISFPSHRGSVVDLLAYESGFDFEKAIADIEAGLIEPLTGDMLSNEDSALSFSGSDGSNEAVSLGGISTYANCAHIYKPGVLSIHAKAADGSCTITTYDAIKCDECKTIWLLDQIGSLYSRVCPH